MQITSPFTRLNLKANEIDFIRKAINAKEKYVTERFYDNYRKMFKSHICIMYCEEEPPTISN